VTDSKTVSKPSWPLRPLALAFVIAAATAAAISASLGQPMTALFAGAESAALHLPRFTLLGSAPPAVQAHVAAVTYALVVGTLLLAGPKGRRLHRVLGWSWVVAMALVALSSLYIREANDGAFSFIHLFTVLTAVSLPIGVIAARRHRVDIHRRTMTGLFVGGMLVAGAFAFLPGRLMWGMFLG
jgi:uncharacterized membrane protein